jgi:hypothetical protein
MSLQAFFGNDLAPGVGTRYETVDNVFFWGRPEAQRWMGGFKIASTTRDVGNTGFTTVLRAGLPLGQITDSGDANFEKLKQWDPTATDGTNVLVGFLEKTLNLLDFAGAAADRFTGRILVSGDIRADRVIMPGVTAPGMAGTTHEHALRAQMFPRFMIDSLLAGNFTGSKPIIVLTADVTLTAAQNNALITNRGAAGAVVPTLPATPARGLEYTFFRIANQNFTVTSGTSNILSGGSASSTIALALNKGVRVVGDGTNWLAFHSDINT